MNEREKDLLAFKEVMEFDKRLDANLKPEDILTIKAADSNEMLKVAPNSSDYVSGENTFNSPVYIQITDYDLLESVSMGLTLKQTEKLISFLQEKVDIVKKSKEEEK